MSYGIVRIQKFKMGSVHGIQIHDRREKDGTSHTNKDIDWGRSHLNYSLDETDKSYHMAVKDRIASLDLPKKPKSDAVTMCQVLVTSDRDFFDKLSDEQSRQYFQQAYDFIAERYGKENIVSATVHLDERTPHLHVNFIPVTEDGRLCARDIITRSKLIDLHDQFFEKVGKAWNLDRGDDEEEGKRKGKRRQHMEVEEYKAVTEAIKPHIENWKAEMRAEVAEVKAETAEARKELAEVEGEIENAETMLEDLTADVNEMGATLTMLQQDEQDALERLEKAKGDIKTAQQEKTALQGELDGMRGDGKKVVDYHNHVLGQFKKLYSDYKQAENVYISLQTKGTELGAQWEERLKDIKKISELEKKVKFAEDNYPDFITRYEEAQRGAREFMREIEAWHDYDMER